MSKAQHNARRSAFLTKDKAKAEVKEKVREIRLRQQNWMKERELAEQQKSVSSIPLTTSASRQLSGICSEGERDNTAPQSNAQNGRRNAISHSNHPSKSDGIEPKGKFKDWLDARNQSKASNVQKVGVVCNQTVVNPNGDETNILRLNSARSVECATPDPGWNKDQVLGPTSSRSDQLHTEIDAGRSMGTDDKYMSNCEKPDRFADRADEIVARVRDTLYVTSQESVCAELVNQNPTTGTIVHRVSTSSVMSSHNCPLCGKVMLSPLWIPMLLNPCGHSLCGECARGRQLCPTCHSPISSCVANIMLQQIITSFQQQNKQKLESKTPKHYQPNLYTDKLTTSYSEALSSLKVRHDVLTTESTTVREELNNMSNQLVREQKQLLNIEKQEERLTNEIRELQERLQGLRGHKEEYKVKVKQLNTQKTELEKKMALIEDTICGVEMELEKVQLLEEETRK